MQESFIKVQPEHPAIDEEVLQRGYAIMSNSSAAFYNRTKTRPPRSVEPYESVPSYDFNSRILFSSILPILVFIIFLVFRIRIFRVR